MKVLVVDDDSDLLAFLKSFLEDEGYEVETARNGKEGLDRILDCPPDLVLLDVHMPVMDGRTLCRILKQSPLTSEIPVIFMSADGTKELNVPFLSKPFELNSLLFEITRKELGQ